MCTLIPCNRHCRVHMIISSPGKGYPAASHVALAQLAKAHNNVVILITPDTQTAEKSFYELKFFAGESFLIEIFPDRETLRYDHFSPYEDLTSERLRILSRLPSLKNGIIIVSVATLMHRLPPKTFLDAYQFS